MFYIVSVCCPVRNIENNWWNKWFEVYIVHSTGITTEKRLAYTEYKNVEGYRDWSAKKDRNKVQHAAKGIIDIIDTYIDIIDNLW